MEDTRLARNRFQWGVPSSWDLGWEWRALGPGWDWGALWFDEAAVAAYRRLAALPAEARAADPDAARLGAGGVALLEHLAALAAAAREAALEDVARRLHFEFFKDAIRLRREHRALDGDAEVTRVYTHNDDSVLAFARRNGRSELLVAGSLNRADLPGYPLPLPPGPWREVFNSDAARYGGGNFGNYGATLPGGTTGVNLPAGGYVVLERLLERSGAW